MLSIPASAQVITVAPVSQSVVGERLDAYVKKNKLREPAVHQLFEDAGCKGDNLAEQPVKHQNAPNLVCTLSGTNGHSIVVGAHFDLVERGDGVVDNWTGAALLSSLYEGMAQQVRRHTFRFVAFTAEEQGMLGSQAYVKQIQAAREPVSAMVNMDTLGLGETEVWISHADPRLVRLFDVALKTVGLKATGMDVERIGSTDSESFRERKIPAITIHSLTQQTLRVLHSSDDRIEKVNRDAYYRSYRTILFYLAVLDAKLDEEPR